MIVPRLDMQVTDIVNKKKGGLRAMTDGCATMDPHEKLGSA